MEWDQGIRKIVFGLKVKQLRQEKQLSFQKLAKETGISVSYLNEIEKGKKFPKEEKIQELAKALDSSSAELTSLELTGPLAAVKELLRSNFLNELPLDFFGLELSKIVEIIARAPAKVGAFIYTLIEMARNYAVREEHFYIGAMRAYLEIFQNYFEELEEKASQVRLELGLSPKAYPSAQELADRLESHFDYTIKPGGLDQYPDLKGLRSLFLPKSRTLLLAEDLSEAQQSFQFGKELGFQLLELPNRAYTSKLLKVLSFEQVFEHYKATYFSVALHMDRDAFRDELSDFFQLSSWTGERIQQWMHTYQASAEMIFQRFSNLIPKFFGMENLFFLRFHHRLDDDHFRLNNELHFNRRHQPHANGLSEHYCRRWLSLSLLKELKEIREAGRYVEVLIGAQRSKYVTTGEEYLCISIAKLSGSRPGHHAGLTIGILLDEESKKRISFWDDPQISQRNVGVTCERCPVVDCKERVAQPVFIEQKQRIRRIQERISQIIEE